MLSFTSQILFAVTAASLAKVGLCVGTPFGLATGTTGGGSAAAAVPTSLAQLTTWLSDSTARTIVLDKIFDFTNSERSVTGAGCQAWACAPNPQVRLYFKRSR